MKVNSFLIAPFPVLREIWLTLMLGCITSTAGGSARGIMGLWIADHRNRTFMDIRAYHIHTIVTIVHSGGTERHRDGVVNDDDTIMEDVGLSADEIDVEMEEAADADDDMVMQDIC
ncbi:hypothetical protein BDV33DRAFT_207876 [Aspergillus novoparasiticus]|uniref:Uncharacterized protein n=1 Tax=Aspergillus novoparasiticus TaxID=986946 RepID=A0A5N6EF01_9EURO|nr:hypothetical protein BDV33DRAFT_207876 [Aspergillus novoparasiticus]